MRALSLIAVLVLAACEAPQQRLDAAEDIHAFLAAAKAGDRAGFDRHVDREALKVQLGGEMNRIIEENSPGLPVAARGPLLDQLVESLGPEAFQMAVRGTPLADRTPGAPELAAVLKPLGDDRVCLPREVGSDACSATFQRQGDVWKLVAVDASGIRMGPAAIGDMLEQFPR